LTDLIDQLRAAVGADHVLTDDADLAAYVVDWTGVHAGRARAVVRPGGMDEVAAVVGACHRAGVAIVPQGGNTGLVGGGVPDGSGDQVVLSLGRMRAVRDVDPVAGTITVDAGVVLADVQAAAERVDRLFPMSLGSEGSCTIGGNLATNAGGTAVLRYGMTRELVLGLEVVLPDGRVWDGLRALRKDNTGYDLTQLFVGSEGTLGVITEAWMRLQPRPRFRAGASVQFGDFGRAVDAAREIAQSGLDPSNCRLLDHDEARLSGSGDGSRSILVLGFESGDHELGPWIARALEIAAGHGGEVAGEEGGDPAAMWRASFLRGPHIRDAMAQLGLIHETFETAVTWDRFAEFHQAVLSAVGQVLRDVCGGGAMSCRFAYVYPDGPSPYYSVYAPGRPGQELEQWDAIKEAASEALLAHGGTITHHHSVGRDHRPWYLREMPELFSAALRATKAELDPAAIMNPGVLLAPGAAQPEESRRTR